MVEGSGEERGGMRVVEGRGGRREEVEFKYRFVLHFYSPTCPPHRSTQASRCTCCTEL